jgi:hypothetical protein
MWQLEIDATNASSGSTAAALDHGAGTTDGEEDAGTVAPPSKLHVCSREYLPFKKSGPFRFQLMVALCSDILFSLDDFFETDAYGIPDVFAKWRNALKSISLIQ